MKRSDLKKWTSKTIISEMKQIYEAVNLLDCFGTNDLILFEWCVRELEERGYSIDVEESLTIKKD